MRFEFGLMIVGAVLLFGGIWGLEQLGRQQACGAATVTTPSTSLYANRSSDGDTATCYANGKSWPARVDGDTLNCFAGDMPKDGEGERK